MNEKLGRSDEEFIKAFKSKYTNHFPPSWIMLEITTFDFGVADTVMVSWLHAMTYIRNVCAHHSRLWNRTLGISPIMPRRTANPFVSLPAKGTRHVYFILAIIQYWLNIVNPSNTFKTKIMALLSKYPAIDISAMGFPSNWEKEAFWL